MVKFLFLMFMLLKTKLNKTVQNIFQYTCCCLSYWGSAESRYRFPNHTATSYICAILFCRRRRSFHAKTLVAFKLCSLASLSYIFIHYFFYQVHHNEQEKTNKIQVSHELIVYIILTMHLLV